MKKHQLYSIIFFTLFLFLKVSLILKPATAEADVFPDDTRWFKNLSTLPGEVDNVTDYGPQIAISGNTLHAVWIGTTNINGTTVYRVYYTRSTNRGISWEPKRMLYEMDYYSGGSFYPNSSRWLAVDNNTVHIFVRKQDSNGYYLIYLRSTDNGVTFSEPRVIDSTNMYSFTHLYTSASSGKVAVSYQKIYRDNNGEDWHLIMLATSTDNGNNFNVRRVAGRKANISISIASAEVIDMQSLGDKIYVFYTFGECYAGYGVQELFVARTFNFGQSIDTVQIYKTPSNITSLCIVNQAHPEFYSPRLAIDGNRVYVIYYAYNTEGKPRIFFRRSIDRGVTFQNPIDLTAELPEGRIGDWLLADNPEFTLTAKNGKVYVIFRDQDFTASSYAFYGKLYLKRSTDGGASFHRIQELTTTGDIALPASVSLVRHPSIFLDPRDTNGSTVYVLADDIFFTYSRDSGASFTGPVALFDLRHEHYSVQSYVRAVMGTNGEIHMITRDYSYPMSSETWYKEGIFYRVIHPTAPTTTSIGNRALSLTMFYRAVSRYDSMLISSSPDLEFNSSFTIEFWVKALINNLGSGLFLAKPFAAGYPKFYSYYLGINYWKRPYVEISTTGGVYSLSGNETFPHDEWTHVAVTFNSNLSQNNLKLYINGKLVGQKTINGTIENSKSPVVIGGCGSIYNTNWLSEGGRINIDELRFWNRALSEDEIRQNMRRYLTGTEPGLVAYYNFDEPFNRYGLVRDITGRGNKGYLIFNETQVAGVEFPLRVISPNGGESINAGSQYRILWQAPSRAVKFKLYHSTDNKTTWNYIAEVGNVREYTWQVPAQDGRKPLSFVRVIAFDSSNQTIGTDDSDRPFVIEVLRVTSPNGGERLKVGSNHTITWQTYALTRTVARVLLQYSTNNGQSWVNIVTLTGNPGSYVWRVPDTPSTQCRVRVILKDSSGAEIARDISDNVFSIVP